MSKPLGPILEKNSGGREGHGGGEGRVVGLVRREKERREQTIRGIGIIEN